MGFARNHFHGESDILWELPGTTFMVKVIPGESQKLPGTTFMMKVIPGAIANLIKISKKNFKKWFLAISSSLYESQKLPGTTFMVKVNPGDSKKVIPGNFQLTI